MLRTKVNVANQRQVGISANGAAHFFSGQFDKSIFQRCFYLCQSIRAPVLPQRLFRDMANEVSGIKSRVSEAIQIEVNQPKPIGLHNNLRRIEVAMDPTRDRCWNAVFQSATGIQQFLQPFGPFWMTRGNFCQAGVENPEFVTQTVLFVRGHVGSVQFVDCFGNTAGDLHSSRSGEQSFSRVARNFALEPHVEIGDHADRLGQRNAVGAFSVKTRYSKSLPASGKPHCQNAARGFFQSRLLSCGSYPAVLLASHTPGRICVRVYDV